MSARVEKLVLDHPVGSGLAPGTRERKRRDGVLLRLLTPALACAVAVSSLLSACGDRNDQSAVADRSTNPGGTYLALGDSLAFGYQPSAEVPPPDYRDAPSFVGYPELAGKTLGLDVVNASCPGETVASMISSHGLSNGCENTDGKGGGYRTTYPLHTAYSGSQLGFAVSYLHSHHDVQLVTIDIGFNDVAVCAQVTADHCVGAREQASLIGEIRTGYATILGALRGAGYHGRLVTLTYYSPTVADRHVISMLDSTLETVTTAFGGTVADGARAFDPQGAFPSDDLCAAGLLVALPGGTCDVHPSPKGQGLLAAAVVATARS
jgi:lysophospholipase L1-like esterase